MSTDPDRHTLLASIGAQVRREPPPQQRQQQPQQQPTGVDPHEPTGKLRVGTDSHQALTPAQRQTRADTAATGRIRRGGDALHLSPGAVIPGTPYRLIRWLGEGGMGVVYEAEHCDIDRRVAIKILRQEVCDDPQALQLFRDEARAAGRIGSPHIVEILDFAELSDGRLLYAMELLGGRSLARELAERPLAPSRVISILRQVCKGLASAHALHIVHRDIKPDNIFLADRQSRRDVVKLLDFGISTFLVGATVTETNILGTPTYLAPEIIAGKPFDARVDMYALGCTAYEMLTGHPPYEGSVKDVLFAHMNEPPPSAAALSHDHDVPLPLAQVVVRCLAKDPAARHVDMDDLEAALCEAQIACALETSWDDLSLPNVDGERRDLLLRRMPDPAMMSMIRRPTPRRSYLLAALAGALLLGGAALVLQRSTAPPAPVDARLARLEADARAAAGRVNFVYPPSDDPGARTAYHIILELEDIDGPQARAAGELAGTLRREFAGTLGAFGDRLWERKGGLEFAVDAYAQALLFDRDLEPAATRADLTPGQLKRLAVKAAAGQFTDTELIAAEPLIVLADADLVVDTPELRETRERIVRRTRARDTALTRDAPPLQPATPSAPPTPPVEPTVPPPPEVAIAAGEPGAPDAAAAVDAASAEPQPAAPARETVTVAQLLEQAREAVRGGRLDDAERLFERVLARDGRNIGALTGLTELYFNRGAYARALGFGERSVAIAPDDAALRVLVGDAAFKAFRYDVARGSYEQAQKLGHPEAERRLAKLAAKLAD